MATELVLIVILVALLGGLFLWVARTRSFTYKSPTGFADHGWLSWPKNCYDLCKRDSNLDADACAVKCSLLQD